MGKSVQRSERKTQKVPRKRLEAQSELSQRASSIGQSITSAKSQPVICTSASDVRLPVTHLVAGATIPVPKALKARYGIGERAMDGSLLYSVGVLESVLSAGLDNDWLKCSAVEHLLSDYTLASTEQGNASFKLANDVLTTIGKQAIELNTPAYKQLSVHNFPSSGECVGKSIKPTAGEWEFVFFADSYEHENVSEYETYSHGLIANESGLCVMQSDISTIEDEELKLNIVQFIQFCCELSRHASSIDMITDEGMKWMAIGEMADIDSKDEKRLMDIAEDEEKLLVELRKMMGDDFEENLFLPYTSLADFYVSYKKAISLSKKVKPLSKKNVSGFLKKLKKSVSSPKWLITGVETLLSKCDWEIDWRDYIKFTGHIEFEFTKPYGLGFPIEEHLFSWLHETLMQGEEDMVSMCVPYCKDSARIIANLDLGETLLLYVNEMLYPDN